MFKRFVAGFLCLCTVVAVSCFSVAKNGSLSVLGYAFNVNSPNTKGDRVIIIDAGHGGFDGGAVAKDGTIEKDLNLAIALRLEAVLRAFGFETVMVRTTDTATNDPDDGEKAKVSDIKHRVELMKLYPEAILVSIHMNKYSTTQPHGAQVFYSCVDGSDLLAENIQASIASHLQNDNKRVIKPTTKDIYLLQHASVPAVIVECGFLSNPNDLNNLKNEDYQLKLAMSVAHGIIQYKISEVEMGVS